MVTIGYSGQAHIDDIPTDDWVARKILGEDVKVNINYRGIGLGKTLPFATLGKYLAILAGQLNDAKRRGRLTGDLEFRLVGFRCKPHQNIWVPCYGQVHWDRATKRYGVAISKRFWSWEGQTRRWISGTLGRSEQRAQVRLRQVISESPDGDNPNHAEAQLLKVMREFAGHDESVGRDYMAVVIKRSSPQIQVRYHPYLADSMLVNFDQARPNMIEAYSPWVIANGIVSPPSVMTGGFILRTKTNVDGLALAIRFDVPEPKGIRKMSELMLFSQPKKAWP